MKMLAKIIVPFLTIFIFTMASFSFAEKQSEIELVPRLLSVKVTSDRCDLSYQMEDFSIKNYGCVIKNKGQTQQIYSALNETVDWMMMNPITKQSELYYQVQPNELIATIDEDNDVILNDQLQSKIESSAKVCAPLSVCDKVEVNDNEILIIQGDYGYLINDHFATIRLRKAPFSIRYSQPLDKQYADDDREEKAFLRVALTSKNALNNVYNNKLTLAATYAFKSGNSYAMAANEYISEAFYGEEYHNWEREILGSNSGYHFLFYHPTEGRVAKGKAVPNGYEFTWTISSLREDGKNSVESWNDINTSQLYLLIDSEINPNIDDTIDLKRLKYIHVKFVE